MSINNVLRQVDHYRRQRMSLLEPMLYKALGNDTYRRAELIPASHVQTILIVRNNKRIGNMFFLLPFVKQMRAAYPHAHITLLLSQPWQGQIFEEIGIDNIVYSHFSAGKLWSFYKQMQQLKTQVFDLLVTPYSSSEDSLIASMIPARNKVASDHPGRNSAFTHVFNNATAEKHSAFHKLFLVERLTKQKLNRASHEMAFTVQELSEGIVAKHALCQDKELTIAFFRGARGAKKLSDKTWHGILDTLQTYSSVPIQWVEILSPDIQTPLIANGLTYQNNNIRVLGSFLKNTTAFLSCDTGPLHLADAAGAKCIGLFTHTCPKKYGVLGQDSINVEDIHSLEMKAYLTRLSRPSSFTH